MSTTDMSDAQRRRQSIRDTSGRYAHGATASAEPDLGDLGDLPAGPGDEPVRVGAGVDLDAAWDLARRSGRPLLIDLPEGSRSIDLMGRPTDVTVHLAGHTRVSRAQDATFGTVGGNARIQMATGCRIDHLDEDASIFFAIGCRIGRSSGRAHISSASRGTTIDDLNEDATLLSATGCRIGRSSGRAHIGTLNNSCHVDRLEEDADISTVRGDSSVGSISGGMIHDIRDTGHVTGPVTGGTIWRIHDDASVDEVTGTARIGTVTDRAGIGVAHGPGVRIDHVAGLGRLGPLDGGVKVGLVTGQAQVGPVKNGSRVDDVSGTARVTLAPGGTVGACGPDATIRRPGTDASGRRRRGPHNLPEHLPSERATAFAAEWAHDAQTRYPSYQAARSRASQVTSAGFAAIVTNASYEIDSLDIDSLDTPDGHQGRINRFGQEGRWTVRPLADRDEYERVVSAMGDEFRANPDDPSRPLVARMPSASGGTGHQPRFVAQGSPEAASPASMTIVFPAGAGGDQPGLPGLPGPDRR